MLESLQLKNVGPGPRMEMTLASRLNLITGDNGLGKSFLLDVAWWALTRKWPHDLNPKLTSGYAARPTDVKRSATIGFRVKGKAGASIEYESEYSAPDQSWLRKAGRPWNPGLVLYALADGGFALWDPARNYWKKKGGQDIQDRVAAYVFGPQDVLDGLTVPVEDKPTRICNGLLSDWASWIRERGPDAERMAAVLGLLGPAEAAGKRLEPGKSFARLSVNDVRDIPTILTTYRHEVPILYASLGIRRIAALCYMLTWAWREHLLAAKQIGEEPTGRVVLLFDEIEAHLHPRWQRTIVPALLKVVETLTGDHKSSIQLVAATHSPIVLASAEPAFDDEQDAWFDLDLERQAVVLQRRPFVRMGTAGRWLTSDAFDLSSEGRPPEAERVLEDAALALSDEAFDKKRARKLDALLRTVLGDTDPFWVRWRFVGEARGWLPGPAARGSLTASVKAKKARARR